MNSEFPIEDLVACARRELALRRRVYPRLIACDRMTEANAEREIDLMAAILDNLENQQSPKLF